MPTWLAGFVAGGVTHRHHISRTDLLKQLPDVWRHVHVALWRACRAPVREPLMVRAHALAQDGNGMAWPADI